MDYKLGQEVTRIVHGDLARRIGYLEEDCVKAGKTVKGRHMPWLLYAEFAQSAANTTAYTLKDLLGLKLNGEDRLPARRIARRVARRVLHCGSRGK